MQKIALHQTKKINKESIIAFVYHIHLPEHVGNFAFGYIGFTSVTVESRWREHRAVAASEQSRTYPVYNAIRKYGDRLICTTLIEGSNEYCLDMEYRLRPKPNLGWNISCGGGAPMLGMKHSEATKERLRNISPETRQKQSDRAKAIPTWLHGSSDSAVWAIANDIYNCFIAHDKISPVLLARAFSLGDKKLEAMHRKFLSGWIPLEDANWVQWSSEQEVKAVVKWVCGDALVLPRKPELTDTLRLARSKGAKNRVWSDEMRAHLRRLNLGRKMPAEAVIKSAEANRGKKRTQAQKDAIKKRLLENPWTNATAIHANWAKAANIFEDLEAGKTVADILRDLNLDRKSAALRNITKKIKAGWNPNEDLAYLAWLSEYNQKQESTNGT